MEHRTKKRKLGRTASHRKALMSNLSVSLIKNKRIKTTLAKAKELRLYIEPLVTKARHAHNDSVPEKSVHLRRVAKSFLKDDEAVKELFEEIGPKMADRQGGYTRVLKTGHRYGDGGDTAIIEFVDFDNVKETEEAEEEKSTKKKKTTKKAAEAPEAKEKSTKKKATKKETGTKAKTKKKTTKKKDE